MKLRKTINLALLGGLVQPPGLLAVALVVFAPGVGHAARVPAAEAFQGGGLASGPCAVWVVRNALDSPRAWRTALDAVQRAGCRRIYLQVSGRWDAYFPSAVFPPPERDPREPGWEDPLGQAIAEAHSRDVEVHAWVNAMLAWSAVDPPSDPSHVFRSHPNWFITDGEGRSIRALDRAALDRAGLAGEGWFLDPARMDVRTELRRFILEIALRYPVDGVHLDYIRYPRGWTPGGGDEALAYLVGLIHDDLVLVRPGATLSAAVLPVPSEARRSFGQAWDEWLARRIIDEVVPMVYRGTADAVVSTVAAYPVSVPRERVWVGVRLDGIGPAEVREAEERLEGYRAAGIALFSHNFLVDLPAWRGVRGLAGGP